MSDAAVDRSRRSSANGKSRKEVDWVAMGVELVLSASLAVAGAIVIRWFSSSMLSLDPTKDPDAVPDAEVYNRLGRILQRRKKNSDGVPQLTTHERQMAEEIIDPNDIESSFADIGGLDKTKQEIFELAILPLVKPELFQGKLVEPVKGILLYGKPGTGKTMLAKALAKESDAVFLPLQLSKILNKWVGESNKLVAATFSLARKIQPAVIFIDELDTFLKANTSETAYLDAIKAEFLTLWDGVATSGSSRILVLGATNRPQNIDSAILRRMPRAFQVPLPDQKGRLDILNLLLKDENMEDGVCVDFLPQLASLTSGYSGSDLKEMAKAAAMVGIQERTAEYARRRVMGEKTDDEDDGSEGDELAHPMRPISKDDLLVGLQKVRKTGAAAKSYGHEEEAQHLEEDCVPMIDASALQNLSILLQALSTTTGPNSTEKKTKAPYGDGDDDDVPEIK